MNNFRFEKYVTEAARKIKLLLHTAIYRIGFETRCFNLKIPSPEDISLFEIHCHSKQVAVFTLVSTLQQQRYTHTGKSMQFSHPHSAHLSLFFVLG